MIDPGSSFMRKTSCIYSPGSGNARRVGHAGVEVQVCDSSDRGFHWILGLLLAFMRQRETETEGGVHSSECVHDEATHDALHWWMAK